MAAGPNPSIGDHAHWCPVLFLPHSLFQKWERMKEILWATGGTSSTGVIFLWQAMPTLKPLWAGSMAQKSWTAAQYLSHCVYICEQPNWSREQDLACTYMWVWDNRGKHGSQDFDVDLEIYLCHMSIHFRLKLWFWGHAKIAQASYITNARFHIFTPAHSLLISFGKKISKW